MRVVVGMATTNKRKAFAEKAVNSLINHVDEIYLVNNDEEHDDLTDNAKFLGLSLEYEPCYYFTCDDDIIYPPTYVRDMIAKIEEYKCIVTHHGRMLKGLDLDYYFEHPAHICTEEELEDRIIDVAGTGVTAFSTEYFNPIDLVFSKDKKMSDLIFSLEAAKQGKKIMAVAHDENYIKDLEVPKMLTIGWTQSVLIAHNKRLFNKDSRQMEIANEIYKLKH